MHSPQLYLVGGVISEYIIKLFISWGPHEFHAKPFKKCLKNAETITNKISLLKCLGTLRPLTLLEVMIL